jgi:hypothetical protein
LTILSASCLLNATCFRLPNKPRDSVQGTTQIAMIACIHNTLSPRRASSIAVSTKIIRAANSWPTVQQSVVVISGDTGSVGFD